MWQIVKVFFGFVCSLHQTVVTGGEFEQVVETHVTSVFGVLDGSHFEIAYMHRKAADGNDTIAWQYWVEKNGYMKNYIF